MTFDNTKSSAAENSIFTAKLLAPYIAVGIFWCGMGNAWLAILAYHAQILFWYRNDWRGIWQPKRSGMVWTAIPCLLAGPLLFLIHPYVIRIDLDVWLDAHRLADTAFLIMIPYFGLIHPILEQLHWHGLRGKTAIAHPLFAGYHLLVLFSLLTPLWLLLCFAVLFTASFVWNRTARATGSLFVPTLGHIFADLGIVLAAWAIIS